MHKNPEPVTDVVDVAVYIIYIYGTKTGLDDGTFVSAPSNTSKIFKEDSDLGRKKKNYPK